jgi:hypothetical protein
MTVVLGLEFEFPVIGAPSIPRAREAACSQLVQHVAASQPHAWGACAKHKRTVFLANGSSLGLDPPGWVPEFCTPECLDPFELATSLVAGMRLVARAARQLSQERGRRLMPVAASILHQSNRTTVGTHESYGVRIFRPFTELYLRRAILPWIICRQLLTEPGTLSGADSSRGFALSPRAPYMKELAGTSTTSPRAVFTLGRAAYAQSGWVRIHIISGGATLSPWAVVLRHGITALLIEMALRGWAPPLALTPDLPLRALRQVSLAPDQPVSTERGSAMPLDILEGLLAEARRVNDRNPLTPWAGRVLAEWEWGLDLLRRASPDGEIWIESHFRRRLLGAYLQKAGMTWDQACFWSRISREMERMNRWGRSRLPQYRSRRTRSAFSPGAQREIDNLLRDHGFTWKDIPKYSRHIERLRALDLELSRVDQGIAERQSEMRSELDLEVVSAHEVARAEKEPPTRTRARARGLLIKLLAGQSPLRSCWDLVAAPGNAFPLWNPLTWRLPRGASRLSA